MKPYETPCAKCGSPDVRRRYVEKGESEDQSNWPKTAAGWAPPTDEFYKKTAKRERRAQIPHLTNICRVCGWRWCLRVLGVPHDGRLVYRDDGHFLGVVTRAELRATTLGRGKRTLSLVTYVSPQNEERVFLTGDTQYVLKNIDGYLRSYLHTALATTLDDAGKPLEQGHGVSSFSAHTLARLADTALHFRRETQPMASLAELDDTALGYNLWLTQNRHGAGFWDGRVEDETVGKNLTRAAHAEGEIELYVGDDKLIYAV